jgi:hypothetical protein
MTHLKKPGFGLFLWLAKGAVPKIVCWFVLQQATL